MPFKLEKLANYLSDNDLTIVKSNYPNDKQFNLMKSQ